MEAEKIINYSGKMRDMLESVYYYNSRFVLNKEQDLLLDKILFAISLIDRRFFVEIGYYDDNALPIGSGQTISQPSTVARMLLLLGVEQGDSILEIGAGSGWNACLLAYLAYPGRVVSVERINALTQKAKDNFSIFQNYLKQKKPEAYQKFSKLGFFTKDIFKIQKGKFDKIIFTAGITIEQEKIIEKIAEKLLKKGGMLICPRVVGPLLIYEKVKRLEKKETKEEYVFVPLLEGIER